ncbi:MAG: hypothetical protein GTN36_02820 [Candidatus Aenigmarchaeota archaeon]|nr:hypothetical protein [Candidatus Aenigmarchaeota archaeon]
MPKRDLPKTLIRALKYLVKNPGTNSSSLHEASKSRASPDYISQRLEKLNLAEECDEEYIITKEGLEKLEQKTLMNYKGE